MFTFGFSSFVKFVLRPFSTSEIINKNRKKKINGTVRHHASFLPVVKCKYLHDETHHCARPMRFRSRGPKESSASSSRKPHQHALVEKAWKDAEQEIAKGGTIRHILGSVFGLSQGTHTKHTGVL